MDSIMVFEGEYTKPESKRELVDVVLGLYSMVLRQRNHGHSQQLHQMICDAYERVFPRNFFEDLPALLFSLMENEDELRTFLDEHTQARKTHSWNQLRKLTRTSQELRRRHPGTPNGGGSERSLMPKRAIAASRSGWRIAGLKVLAVGRGQRRIRPAPDTPVHESMTRGRSRLEYDDTAGHGPQSDVPPGSAEGRRSTRKYLVDERGA